MQEKARVASTTSGELQGIKVKRLHLGVAACDLSCHIHTNPVISLNQDMQDKYEDMKGYLSVTYPPNLSSHIYVFSQVP